MIGGLMLVPILLSLLSPRVFMVIAGVCSLALTVHAWMSWRAGMFSRAKVPLLLAAIALLVSCAIFYAQSIRTRMMAADLKEAEARATVAEAALDSAVASNASLSRQLVDQNREIDSLADTNEKLQAALQEQRAKMEQFKANATQQNSVSNARALKVLRREWRPPATHGSDEMNRWMRERP